MGYTIEDRFIRSSRNNLKIAISIYKPDGLKRAAPTIVMGHGIGAIKSAGLSPFASAFTSEGYVAITFDYIGFGESEGSPRNILNVQDELQDFRDVIRWLREPPDEPDWWWVDPTSIVAWGTSFGGMHVTALMSEDQQEGGLAAGISQCPLVDGSAGILQMPLARSLKLAAAAMADIVSCWLLGAKEPQYVQLVSDGSTTAVLGSSQEVVEGWARLAPENAESWPNMIAGRSLLSIMLSRPLKQVHKSTRPYLIVLPTWDHQASLDAAEECVKQAPLGEALRVEGGHFDLYKGGKSFEKNVEGQKQFLKRVLKRQ